MLPTVLPLQGTFSRFSTEEVNFPQAFELLGAATSEWAFIPLHAFDAWAALATSEPPPGVA